MDCLATLEGKIVIDSKFNVSGVSMRTKEVNELIIYCEVINNKYL
jgi:hypothetical protein